MAPKYKIGDYVKANPDNEEIQESGRENYAGKVIEFDKFLGDYTVELDAHTLNGMSDEFIRMMHINYFILDEKEFEQDELLPSQRRDTDEEYAKAKARIDASWAALEKEGLVESGDDEGSDSNPFDNPERIQKIILSELARSKSLQEFTADHRSEICADAGLMLEVAHNYYDLDHPEEWTPDFVEDYALGHLPRKFLGRPEDFERMGKNLVIFLWWLYEEELTDCGRLLIKTMQKAAPKMAAAAEDKGSWGLSKSLFSGALDQGVDLSDQSQLDAFVQNFNNLPFEERVAQTGGPADAKIVGLDPFRNLGRNDRINVRNTTTGEVTEKIKFKQVEKLLRSGVLEIFVPSKR